MASNLGRTFPHFTAMAEEAGNAAKCSSETAKRWIRQFAAGNGDFQLLADSRILTLRGTKGKSPEVPERRMRRRRSDKRALKFK